MEAFFIFLFCFTISFHALVADTIVMNQVIKDGQTIISSQQNFELGFFSPSNATENRYLGIRFKRLATGTVVWVANRETPIRNKSGELTFHSDGVLVLRDSADNRVIWSSGTQGSGQNPVARLLDNGNLMITDDDNGLENYIWQSFDYFGDSDIPGMKFGRNSKGIVTNYTSWKSPDDPSKGSFMVYMDFNGLPQVIQKNGDVIQYRLGSWNGIAFTGRPKKVLTRSNSLYAFKYVSIENEIYCTTELYNSSVLTKFTLSPDGTTARYSWLNQTQGWFEFASPMTDSCGKYKLCGPYGSCDIQQSPSCGCLKGFTPTRLDQWDLGVWSSGCRREIPLDCGVGKGFQKLQFVKLPDTQQSWFDRNMTLKQCEIKCKSECNCTAYATLNIVYGTGCVLWHGELIDMRTFPDTGQDIYIRLASAELAKYTKSSKSNKKVRNIVIPVVLGFIILLGLFLLIIKKRKLKARGRHGAVVEKESFVLPLFSLSVLLTATNNFSEENKLGEGGFGPVYKGYLEDGREVAVKRLSRSSSQGVEEFINEVFFISKLQHRNLVKIIGYCIEGEERLLVYEYMPNKGLDLYICQDNSKKLNWPQQFHIINGIARGLLYLHQDSQLRIIHRDLKAANILLDHEMNPKISDFGTARSFIEDDTKTNTKRLVGTYGYMSPEYAGDGIISVKSDIFSFGVILLEVLSGKKNRGFSHEAHCQNLLGHAWMLYKDGKALELVNVSSLNSNQISEVLRWIQVGLLCVQHNPDDRPNMSEVISMLSGKGRLTEPKHPGFFTEFSCESSTIVEKQCTNNDVTITLLEAR